MRNIMVTTMKMMCNFNSLKSKPNKKVNWLIDFFFGTYVQLNSHKQWNDTAIMDAKNEFERTQKEVNELQQQNKANHRGNDSEFPKPFNEDLGDSTVIPTKEDIEKLVVDKRKEVWTKFMHLFFFFFFVNVGVGIHASFLFRIFWKNTPPKLWSMKW